MNWIFKAVPWFIGTVFVIIIGWYILIGYVAVSAYNTVSDKTLSGVAYEAGRLVKSFNDGMQ